MKHLFLVLAGPARASRKTFAPRNLSYGTGFERGKMEMALPNKDELGSMAIKSSSSGECRYKNPRLPQGVNLTHKRVFETMNGLRGVAALAVVAFHWSLMEPLNLRYGFLAVDLFFVLSGFVIAHSYEDKLLNDLSATNFFLIRMIRLYPLYILGTFFSILIICFSVFVHGLTETNINGVIEVPFAMLMIPCPPLTSDWADVDLYRLNRPAWSLFYEVIVNIAYAASAYFWSVKNLFLLMSFVAFCLMLHLFLTGSLYGHGGIDWGSIGLGILRVFYSFPAGVMIYKIYKSRSVFSKILFSKIPSVVIVCILPVLFMLPTLIPEYYAVPLNVLVMFPVLVIIAAFSEEPKGPFASLCKSLGAASYAIYAIHYPLHSIVVATLAKITSAPTPLLTDVVLMAMIVPLSLFVDRIYDTPLRKFLVRRFLPSKIP